MRHADHPHPGVPCRVAVGRELFEVSAVGGRGRRRVLRAEAGLLGQFTGRRRAQVLVALDEAAGQRPAPLERCLTTPYDQRAQGVTPHGEHDQVDGDCERGVSRRVVGRHAGDLSRLPDDKHPFQPGRPTSSPPPRPAPGPGPHRGRTGAAPPRRPAPGDPADRLRRSEDTAGAGPAPQAPRGGRRPATATPPPVPAPLLLSIASPSLLRPASRRFRTPVSRQLSSPAVRHDRQQDRAPSAGSDGASATTPSPVRSS